VSKITVIRSALEMSTVRALWESLYRGGRYTIFQKYLWNLLAISAFSSRQRPWVICAEASYGAAIVPAGLCRQINILKLLGEELFDYRSFLHSGDDEVLRTALAELAPLTAPLEIVAVRNNDLLPIFDELGIERFSAAPAVHHSDVSSDDFAVRHGRLGRNLRRLARLGFELKLHHGDNSRLLRSIYRHKAEQHPCSLFRDPLRIDFLVNAAAVEPKTFEIFTLECGPHLGAALVTLRDRGFRRFYTVWFDAALQKHSPGTTLIYEVTRQSLAAGLDCDYMTGEQGHKARLATRVEPLYRIAASSRQLAALGSSYLRQIA